MRSHISSLAVIVIASCSFAAQVAAEEGAPKRAGADPFEAQRYRTLRVPLSDLQERGQASLGHAMLPALRYAYGRYDQMQRQVRDYRGKLVMRERIQGLLQPREFMDFKIRHRHVEKSGRAVPFSVYLNYRSPSKVKGREVLFVEGANDGKMVATRGGGKALNDITLWLPPTSARAMRGKHYPITDFGVMNLTRRLIEYGTDEMELEAGRDAQVRFTKGAKIDKRPCVMIEVKHPERRAGLHYHVARIFVDEEHQVPVRYAAYSWPPEKGELPLLMEEYTYLNLELNVGFSDADFDATNSEYAFREPRDAKASEEQEAVETDQAVASSGE